MPGDKSIIDSSLVSHPPSLEATSDTHPRPGVFFAYCENDRCAEFVSSQDKKLCDECQKVYCDECQKVNVVFLDIDGVLLGDRRGQTCLAAYNANKELIQSKGGKQCENLNPYDIGATLLFDEDGVENLKILCELTQAKIVISSSWRNSEDREKSLAKLRGLFSLHDLEIMDETPSLKSQDRALEIKEWLAKNNVNCFVVIDDDGRLLEAFPNNCVYIDPDKRFKTKEYLEQALSIFGVRSHLRKTP